MLSFFPLDVLDEIWDLIESVSERFLTYSLVSYVCPLVELSCCNNVNGGQEIGVSET